MSRLTELSSSRELVINLTLRELRSRYKRSFLGWTWSLLNPLAAVLVFSMVFSFFLKITPPVGDPSGLDNFALFLLCALVPWNFFSSGVTAAMGSLVGNASLVKKVYFPRELLPISVILSLLVTLLIELGVVVVILLVAGNMVLPWIPMILLLVVIEGVFVAGLALTLAACNVYFRDLQYLMTIILQVLFYAVPIVYPLRYVPDQATILGVEIPLGELYRANPLVQFVGAFRDVMYDLRFPSVDTIAYLLAWALGMLALGFWVFSRLDRRLAEEV